MTVATVGAVNVGHGFRFINDTDSDNTVETNVAGGTITVMAVMINNNANASAVYTRIWDRITGITNGTTDPDFLLPGNANTVNNGFTVHFFLNIDGTVGWRFTNGISYSTVTNEGTAGTTSPTGNVSVTFLIKD